MTTWPQSLKARFTLPVDPKDGTVRVSRLVVRRVRLLLAASLTLNLLIGWAWVETVERARFQGPVLGHAGRMAEAAREMALLFAEQTGTITRAYALYGEAVTSEGPARDQAYAAYRREIEAFNQRSERLAMLGHRIRNRAASLAPLLGHKETP